MDGTTVDDRISLPGMDLQYCLKLPQSSYDPGTGDITALSTPGTPAKSAPHSPVKKYFLVRLVAMRLIMIFPSQPPNTLLLLKLSLRK